MRKSVVTKEVTEEDLSSALRESRISVRTRSAGYEGLLRWWVCEERKHRGRVAGTG